MIERRAPHAYRAASSFSFMADEMLHKLGFTKVQVLYIADNFGTDWVDKGYPATQDKG